ncbi:MAG: SAM-dependent methyltransferase [Candidatus Hodarchaeota archaeon]
MRKRRDYYTKKAKQEGYRSRAAYKLLQIDKKFNLFHENQAIIDLCGAPGGFSQVARDQTCQKGDIFLVDLARIKPIPHITEIIKGDITKISTIVQLQECLKKHGSEEKEIVVLADCSPNVSGHWLTDHARQIWLAEVALGISNYFLAEKFLTKVFQGQLFKKYILKIKNVYKIVKIHKPETSRKRSAETYIIASERLNRDVPRYNRESLILDE